MVHKGDLHELVNGINRSLLTTLAACGDVVRNVMGCPWPDERQAVVRPLLAALVARFRPQTAAYWELWVDGERAVSAVPALTEGGTAAEPVYGDVYLPRKFKIGVAWPGDNCVDVFSNDVALVPTLGEPATSPMATVRWSRDTWCTSAAAWAWPGARGRHLPAARIAARMGHPGPRDRHRRGRRHHPARPRQP